MNRRPRFIGGDHQTSPFRRWRVVTTRDVMIILDIATDRNGDRDGGALRNLELLEYFSPPSLNYMLRLGMPSIR